MKQILIATLCFIFAASGLSHHYILTGVWFQLEDMMHHEPLIMMCVMLGVGILIGRRG